MRINTRAKIEPSLMGEYRRKCSRHVFLSRAHKTRGEKKSCEKEVLCFTPGQQEGGAVLGDRGNALSSVESTAGRKLKNGEPMHVKRA